MNWHCGACSDLAGYPVIYTPDEYADHDCPSVPAVEDEP